MPDYKAKYASFLALGRYDLTEEDIHSRANVRHLMARSDQLDEALAEIKTLSRQNSDLKTRLAVLEVRAARNNVYEVFTTFCVAAGFAAFGYGVSFPTANPANRDQGIIWVVFGLIVALGAVAAQLRSRSHG